MNVYVDDLIERLLKIKEDGYAYCSIEVWEFEGTEDGKLADYIMLWALDEGGSLGVEYTDDDDTDIYEVPGSELIAYAFRNRSPAPERKVLRMNEGGDQKCQH